MKKIKKDLSYILELIDEIKENSEVDYDIRTSDNKKYLGKMSNFCFNMMDLMGQYCDSNPNIDSGKIIEKLFNMFSEMYMLNKEGLKKAYKELEEEITLDI